MLETHGIDVIDFEYTLPTNLNFAFKIPTGEMILLPNNFSSDIQNNEGLIFKNSQCLDKYVEQDLFPITNKQNRIEESFQIEITDINNQISNLVGYTINFLKINISVDKISSETLGSLLLELKNNKSKMNKKEFVYTALILGEFIRQKTDGNWILIKQYGQFNPYYIPGILYPNGGVVQIDDHCESFLETSSSLSDFLLFSNIYIPALNINDPNFATYFVDSIFIK